MSTLNKEEYFASIRTIIGDRNDDDAIKFLEDMTDTFNAMENGVAGDGINWKEKFEKNDKAWADRYRRRFLNGDGGNGPSASNGSNGNGYDPSAVEYRDLFK